MGSNNSQCKSERDFLIQYNSIYQVMYDQKHITDFLMYLRQKLSEQGHFAQIPKGKLFDCFQDDIETICLKLSLSDMDQITAISIYDYLQFIVLSQSKLQGLQASYEEYIFLLKDKINCEKTKHNKEYSVLFERFKNKYEELKEMLQTISKIDEKTIKSCLKTCCQKYSIPARYSKNAQILQDNINDQKQSTFCTLPNKDDSELYEAY